MLNVNLELKAFVYMLIDPTLYECASWENTTLVGLHHTVIVLEQS